MKTSEEIKKIKEEYEVLKEKLADLTEEELHQVFGGEWGPGWGEDWILICERCAYKTKTGMPGDECPKCHNGKLREKRV